MATTTSKKSNTPSEEILAEVPLGKAKDTTTMQKVEEGRHKEGSDTDHSITEGTDADPLHHHTPKSLSRRNKMIWILAVVLCTIVLVGIGTALGLLLPDILDDDDTKDVSNVDNSTDSTGPITFNYTSIDASDDRNGGFYSDPSGNALNDGEAEDLQGGTVLAWKLSTQSEDSTHRIVIDLKKPQDITRVNVSGIVLERWGLEAPKGLRLQIFGSEDAEEPFFDHLNYNAAEPDENNLEAEFWVQTFHLPKNSFTVRAELIVTCPSGEARANNLNMKCGISEIEFF